MDASLQLRAEQLATEFASQAKTAEDLNGLMRLMMKSALERMLNTEMDVHLGRRPSPRAAVAELPPNDLASGELPPCEPSGVDGAGCGNALPTVAMASRPKQCREIWGN